MSSGWDCPRLRARRGSAVALGGALLVAAGIIATFGCGAGRAVSRSASGTQALRTCVDRWNQDNMLSWGSLSARIAVRALNARERGSVSFGDDTQQRCTVSLAGRPG